jgi:type IV pilus assembly protein PilQ
VPKPPGADLLFDKKTHVLIVKNNRENLAKAEEIIESLDVCPPQVLIEARFITTEITDLRELGVDWILNSAITVSKQNVLNNGVAMNSPQTQIASGSSVGFTPFQNTANGMNLTYQGLLTDPMFQAVLHALETSGKSRTLSVPRVTTVNNRAATIRIGQDYRYFDQYGTQTYSSSGSSMGLNTIVNETTVVVPVGKPEIEELGIELNVIPSVGADLQTVTLQMAPSIKGTAPEAQWFSYSMPEQLANGAITNVLITLPVFTVSEMKTEVNVQSGETVVMGGLISSTESKSVERVPILSSIPFIGKLFQHDTTSEDKENLLIFVTATILSDRGESLIPINEVPEEQANPMEKAAGN